MSVPLPVRQGARASESVVSYVLNQPSRYVASTLPCSTSYTEHVGTLELGVAVIVVLNTVHCSSREGGFEAFSMAKLAKLTGVVKGTLYLYFETREEVFLVLYNQKMLF